MDPQLFKPYLLYIGRLEAKKNTGNLLRAWEILKNKYRIPHSLVLIGQRGTGCPPIKGPQVHTLGWVGERGEFLAQADLFIFPSHYEGFGLPILEAWQKNIPIVCSDIPTLHEIGQDACFYFNQNDPQDMAEKIYPLLNNKKQQNILIQKGALRLQNFSWPKCTAETWQTLASLLK